MGEVRGWFEREGLLVRGSVMLKALHKGPKSVLLLGVKFPNANLPGSRLQAGGEDLRDHIPALGRTIGGGR